MKKILLNKVKCLKCNIEIISMYTHDFKWCPCGNIAVDGGKSYLKRAGNLEEGSYLELSEEI